METIISFLADNYIWFLIITLILVFALIGYLVDIKQDERFTKKISLDKEVMDKVEVAETVNLTLNDMVSETQNKDIVVDNLKSSEWGFLFD